MGSARSVSVGGTSVRVVMAIGRARAECTSPETYDNEGEKLYPNPSSICTGKCLTAETIINPTAAERADPTYYLDWVTYCTISDSNTGDYEVRVPSLSLPPPALGAGHLAHLSLRVDGSGGGVWR